jgi:hypothetical protein
MRKLYPFLLITAVLAGCISAEKLAQQGQYDQAIDVAVRKIRRKPKTKDIKALESAYNKANDKDRERVKFLQLQGTPDRWEEIFRIYSWMDTRQNKIKPLMPIEYAGGTPVNLPMVDYSNEMVEAKKKAAEYYYTSGVYLLEQGGKENARKAHANFLRVVHYFRDYKDVNLKITDAKLAGTSYVIFNMANKTGVPLPPSFEEDLKKISLLELNTTWLEYHTYPVKDLQYDYTILVNMKVIDVSPEDRLIIEREETKEIQDGTKYVLDEKGNVKKDTAGNDIKVPNYVTIRCKVKEIQLKKAAHIGGTLDYIDNNNGQMVKTDPIAADFFFEDRAVDVFGDQRALTPETKKLIGKPLAGFPNDFFLLQQAGGVLKNMVKDIIWRHKGLLY